MTDRPDANRTSEFLVEFASLIDEDKLPGEASRILQDATDIVSELHDTGTVFTPADPFKGRALQPVDDADIYYTMFWRLFDRTPASMVQSLAIPMRLILAKRIFKHCGDGVIFHHNVLFSQGAHISIGDHSLINRYVMLDDRAELNIGSFVMVAAGVTIETHTHPFDDFSLPIAYGGREGIPVSVGDNTVLGYNTVVTAGVTIGYRCIVGANSVVTADVPDYQMVGGVPARLIREYQPPERGSVWQPSDGRPGGV